ncbi:MAG: alpha/beta fold hydrolase [Polyangiaceae bacterium]
MDSDPPESLRDQPPLSVRLGLRGLDMGQPQPSPQPPPKPFWFGTVERPLFGWYHAPKHRTPRACVVMCNAFGHEAMVAHRTYRRLALRLAAEGFGVLRFDYDGTGDSAGDDGDDARVQSWLESIRLAVNEATALSGAREVVLFGTRLGALLAATYAARFPVDSLVLLAPPRSGKAWLREMRALQALKNVPRAEGEGEGEGEASEPGIAGFLMQPTTRADISALELGKLQARPARNAFVLARDDLPGNEAALVTYLGTLGANAKLDTTPGFAASMPEDPFKAVVPTQLFESMVTWLDGLYPTESTSLDREQPVTPSTRPSMTTMTRPTYATQEQVVDVAGNFGILTEPAVPSDQTGTAVLLLNIGANHHIGSNRMYVHMARAWAAQGFQILRMDFSGMGDSPAQAGKENDVYSNRSMAETRSAIDFMLAQGARRVVLMGLCSGAYVAYHTAIADPRVSGIVMINPLTFHWTEGDSLEVRMRKSFRSTEQYKRTLFRLETWRRIASGSVSVRAIAGELGRRAQKRATREARAIIARVTGDIAEATDIERGFRQLTARGTRCLMVFGAEDGGVDVIEEHLGRDAASMRNAPGFRMEILEGPDHTFTPLWTQRRLLHLVSEYLDEVRAGT